MKQKNKNTNGTDEIAKRYEEERKESGLKYGIIEVTSNCQFECPGCYMVRRDSLNKGEMSLDQAVEILDLCKDYKDGEELETMDLLGGEPTIWQPLKEYIVELQNRNIKPWIFTNMFAMTEELAGWLFEKEVFLTGKLNIGDPTDESQIGLQAEMIGRNKETARKMIEKIELIKSVGYKEPMFRVQNLIRKKNIELVPQYYEFCLENGIGTDLELMGSGEGVDENYFRIAPTPKQLADMTMEIQEVRKQYGMAEAEVLMPHVFGSCPFYDKGLFFAVDDTIRSCSNSTQTLATITDKEPIKKAYESELICNRLELTQEKIGEPCGSCETEKYDKCRGGCRATVEGTGDSLGGYELCPVPILKTMNGEESGKIR